MFFSFSLLLKRRCVKTVELGQVFCPYHAPPYEEILRKLMKKKKYKGSSSYVVE
jgi:hypothetical protein